MSKYGDMLGVTDAERKGHFVSQLDQDQLRDLDAFVEWIRVHPTPRTGKPMTDGSRGSYRSYMAEVMIIGSTDGTLEGHPNKSSLMSALRLFEEFWAETHEQDLDEDFDHVED